jgi:hypothetical protein
VPDRRFEDGELLSDVSPPMRIRVDPSFAYLGASSLELKGLALAERHYLVDADGRRVRRMLVVQFEGFLASNDEAYRYRLPDPVILGGETYGTWVFCYSVAEAVAEDPAAESADMLRVLSDHALTLEDAQIMARFARIVGEDARHEVLLFYHENVRDLGYSLRELCEDGAVRQELAGVADALRQRALASFVIDAYSDSA